MSDVRPLSETLAASLATLERATAAHAAWLLTPEGRAHAAHVEGQARERRRRELAALADERDIPAERGLRAAALADDPPVTRALELVRNALAWRARQRGEGGAAPVVRVLAGPPGIGKSTALAWAVARHAGRARFVTSATIVATVRNGHSDPEAAWRAWEACDLLCVDEAGFELGDATALAALPTLLATRYNAGRATLLATNLSRAAWDARFPGERLRDRLENGQEHAGAKTGLRWFATVRGASLRNPAALAALVGNGGDRG